MSRYSHLLICTSKSKYWKTQSNSQFRKRVSTQIAGTPSNRLPEFCLAQTRVMIPWADKFIKLGNSSTKSVQLETILTSHQVNLRNWLRHNTLKISHFKGQICNYYFKNGQAIIKVWTFFHFALWSQHFTKCVEKKRVLTNS